MHGQRPRPFVLRARFWGPPNLLSSWYSNIFSPEENELCYELAHTHTHTGVFGAEIKMCRAVASIPHKSSWPVV